MVIDVGDHRIYPDHPSPGGPVIQGHSSKLFTPLRPTHAKRPPQSAFVLTGYTETPVTVHGSWCLVDRQTIFELGRV
jgi:hypothetical protein